MIGKTALMAAGLLGLFALPALGQTGIDRLQLYLSRCWTPPSSSPKTESIEVRIFTDRQGNVLDAAPNPPPGADSVVRALGNAAANAVRKCSPLPMSPELAEQVSGGRLVFRFDPRPLHLRGQ
ncbi:cell envelope integrity protein TolA [Magnetospirillum sp. UT-4]|uniref:cell envelope integrity protein TolA n=1 Tax=Magnetospirillum sp. UT-4 TaxID=2681467 RepID=UPI00137DD5DB|nr:cell envelope integrity protein TolA [Magnetospirillum sp. UT-4]CAA7625645.1 exported hypothetical protein [Magnetospirillum sp. UT-4]